MMGEERNDPAGDPTDRALHEFVTRWTNAVRCFAATDRPQWKRTTDVLTCFKGLSLDHLPRKLRRRIDTHFAQINPILLAYTIQTWDDYQRISTANLSRIESILTALVDTD